MNDYEYALHLEKLIKYEEDKARNQYYMVSGKEDMYKAIMESASTLRKILDVHMQNSIARACIKGRELRDDLIRLAELAKEKIA